MCVRACVASAHTSVSNRVACDYCLLFHQGETGNNFNPASKGEQGILGFPGVRVGDQGRMHHACKIYTHLQTVLNIFHFQGAPGFPGRDGQAGREVQPHDDPID